MKEANLSKLKKGDLFVFTGRNISYRYMGKKQKKFFYINPANDKEYSTKYDCTIQMFTTLK